MAETVAFSTWTHRQLHSLETIEAKVEKDMYPSNLRVEGRESGQWEEIK